MKTKIETAVFNFLYREDGLALTEYLILLGLLAGVVIGAVTAFGGNLGTSWTGWGTWLTGNVSAPSS